MSDPVIYSISIDLPDDVTKEQRKDFLNEIHELVTGIVTKMCDIHGLEATQIEFSGLDGTEEPHERLH